MIGEAGSLTYILDKSSTLFSHHYIMFQAPMMWVPLESTDLQQHASINPMLVYVCNFIYVYGFSGVE